MEYYTVYSSPLGELTLASDGESLTGLWMEGQRYFGAGEVFRATRDALPVFAAAKTWLDAYFSAQPLPDLPPLAPEGTDFRRRVWQQLLAVPYGKTVTYGELAAMVGCASARAVGAAVGRNPILLMIPCHRVVGVNGKLTGYAGGLARKQWLLAHEESNRTK